jgi:hypothetical protein
MEVLYEGTRQNQGRIVEKGSPSSRGSLTYAFGHLFASSDFVWSLYAEIGVEAGAFQPGIWMLTDW